MDNVFTNWRISLLSVALLAQIAVAVPLLGVIWWLMAGSAKATPLFLLLFFFQSGLAALLGWFFGLRRWWLVFQLLLPPALALGVWAQAPSWIYPSAFLALLLIYWNSAGEKVPLYLTNRKTRTALAELLPEKTDLAFADLGCGFGGVLAYLARRRPLASFAGIESAPALFLASWLRLKFFGPPNVSIIFRDYWKQDLGRYDVVYCFMSPAPMAELYAKVRSEMRPGSLFISNSFKVPEFPADETVAVGDRRGTKLHVWRI